MSVREPRDNELQWIEEDRIVKLHEKNLFPLRSEDHQRMSIQMINEIKLEAYETRNVVTNIYIESMTNVNMWICRANELDFNATISIEGYIHPQKKGFIRLDVKNKRKNRIRLDKGDIVAYLILTPYLQV